MNADDIRPLVENGISRDTVRDAIYICYVFSIMTRLADTLDWDIPSAEALADGARALLKRGYA